jgi:hypothetical protein
VLIESDIAYAELLASVSILLSTLLKVSPSSSLKTIVCL